MEPSDRPTDSSTRPLSICGPLQSIRPLRAIHSVSTEYSPRSTRLVSSLFAAAWSTQPLLRTVIYCSPAIHNINTQARYYHKRGICFLGSDCRYLYSVLFVSIMAVLCVPVVEPFVRMSICLVSMNSQARSPDKACQCDSGHGFQLEVP